MSKAVLLEKMILLFLQERSVHLSQVKAELLLLKISRYKFLYFCL